MWFGCFGILSDALGHIISFPSFHVLSHNASDFDHTHAQSCIGIRR